MAESSSTSWELPLVAVCQVTSTPNKQENFKTCAELVQEATRLGACLAFLPEAFDFIARNPAETLLLSEPLDGDLLGQYSQLARECGIWLSLGGFHERGQDWEQTQKIYNCHVLLNSKGETSQSFSLPLPRLIYLLPTQIFSIFLNCLALGVFLFCFECFCS